jgi:hypothetical protein
VLWLGGHALEKNVEVIMKIWQKVLMAVGILAIAALVVLIAFAAAVS